MNNWLPKSVLCLKSYTKRLFVADLLSGITVGLVALPLAMAFAIASGVPPQAGLYCAIVAGFVISALGGSKTQIGGPTGAFVVVVFGIVAKYGMDGLFMCTLMAGVFLLILARPVWARPSNSYRVPVVVGFTNGIAVIIASTQIKDFFGLKIDKVPGEFLGRIQTIAHNFYSFSSAGDGPSGCSPCCDYRFHALRKTGSGLYRRALCWYGGGRAAQTAGRNNWHSLWRYSLRAANA